jgi:phosphatidylglycerophosphatase A
MTKNKENNLKNDFYCNLATGFGVGKIPFAPGTFGSILGVMIWFAVNYFFFTNPVASEMNSPQFLFWFLFIILSFIFGIKSATIYEKNSKKEDAKEVIIDEVCGQIITLFTAYFMMGLFKQISVSFDNIIFLTLSFLAFRFFDITKPFVIGDVDKMVKGGFGVMIDDVLAGFAGSILVILYFGLQ